jgi:hypothetical protein
VADASHELRTPLATIRGRSEVLLLSPTLDHHTREGLVMIRDEAGRMGRLVANLLLLAQGDEARAIARRPVELDVLLLEVARQARALAQDVSVTLSHEDQALVRGDADLLKQLLLNLVDNALTYTPPGGHVDLALSVADGHARLAVQDTGPGIPPAEVARIFERFYRLDRARSRRSGGASMGLAIARWIAEAHGGRIEVQSTVGQGSSHPALIKGSYAGDGWRREGKAHMNVQDPDAGLSLPDLLSTATSLFERVHGPLLLGSQGPQGLSVRYVRRKPGRRLAVIYDVYAGCAGGGPRVSPRAHPGRHTRAMSLTLEEQALDGTRIRLSARQVQQAPVQVEVQPAGVVRVRDLGLCVQAFPADGGLPALAASCTPTAQEPLWQALESAACAQLGDGGWRLVAARAEPVRYKPANRCVIRYHLTLEHPHPRGDNRSTHRNLRDLTLFGKVYADRQEACFVEAMMQQLYAEQAGLQSGALFLARPLGLVDALGLRLDAAVQPADGHAGPVLTGRQALRPRVVRTQAGKITTASIPRDALRRTALALALLHTSAVRPTEAMRRTGAQEAQRVCKRAEVIAACYPAQAEAVLQFAQQLAAHLERVHPDAYRPVHGGFKPSALLFPGPHAVMVDFDGFCLADAALDVGYFLAYLRPSGLWCHRPGLRDWFERAATEFVSAYRTAMLARGVAHAEIDGILERIRLYEAAILVKIATRRLHHLNSPRPQELSAMLGAIAGCLTGEGRRP